MHRSRNSKPRQDVHLDAEVERAYRQLRGRATIHRYHGLIRFDLWMTWQPQYTIA